MRVRVLLCLCVSVCVVRVPVCVRVLVCVSVTACLDELTSVCSSLRLACAYLCVSVALRLPPQPHAPQHSPHLPPPPSRSRARSYRNYLGRQGCSLLHVAVLLGDLDAYDMLVDQFDLDPDAQAVGLLLAPPPSSSSASSSSSSLSSTSSSSSDRKNADDDDAAVAASAAAQEDRRLVLLRAKPITAEELLLERFRIDLPLLQEDEEDDYDNNDDDHDGNSAKDNNSRGGGGGGRRNGGRIERLRSHGFQPYPFDIEEGNIRNMFAAQEPRLGGGTALTRGQFFQLLQVCAYVCFCVCWFVWLFVWLCVGVCLCVWLCVG